MTSEEEQVEPAEEPVLCADCGRPEGTFACRVRHVGVLSGNSEAKKHDEYRRKLRQYNHYGV